MTPRALASITTPAQLETLIDGALGKLLSLADDLRAHELNGKPAITPKELTEALELAVLYWDKKRGPGSEPWGTKLGGKGAA